MPMALRCSFVCSFALLVACGDDGGGSATSTGSTSEAASTSTGPTMTGSPNSTSGDTQADTTAAVTTAAGTDSGSDTGASETGTTGDTAGLDCTMIPAGPFAAERILEDVPFGESEDLGFDGLGHLAARGVGDAYLLVSADGTYEELTTDDRKTYGLRFLANGDLVAAAYEVSDILRVTPAGEISSFIDNVGGVNGLFPDSMGGVWYTNFSEVGYVDDQGNDQSVIPSAANANGIFFDEARQIIFFTDYGSGALRKSVLDNGAPQPAVEVGSIDGSPDGITLDACGNLYAVDQANSDLYRVMLDDNAEPLADAELLVTDGFPTNVANAQFGAGDGWDAEALYVIGVGSGLYRVQVGVPGAPYVTVQ